MEQTRSLNGIHVTNFIKRRKANLRSIFHSRCCLCGFDAVPEALEFHHVDPSTKEFGIGAKGHATKNLEVQLKEARKCILVCSNCHRGIHQGIYQVPESWQSFFDEEIAQRLQDELTEFKTKSIYRCARCRKEISYGATYCDACRKFLSRSCERPTREELKEMIRTMPFTHIAELYNLTDNTIRKWCDAYNLPRKKSVIKNYSDEEWEDV